MEHHYDTVKLLVIDIPVWDTLYLKWLCVSLIIRGSVSNNLELSITERINKYRMCINKKFQFFITYPIKNRIN